MIFNCPFYQLALFEAQKVAFVSCYVVEHTNLSYTWIVVAGERVATFQSLRTGLYVPYMVVIFRLKT